MIRLTLAGRGAKPLYVLGITQLNVDRLVAGNPIKVELEELGGNDSVIVLYAPDAEALRKEVAKVVSPDELAQITPMFDQLGASEREIRRAASSAAHLAAIEACMADMREARQSHVEWAGYLDRPDVDARSPRAVGEVAGDADYHRQWVEKYDRVIAVLRNGTPASGGNA